MEDGADPVDQPRPKLFWAKVVVATGFALIALLLLAVSTIASSVLIVGHQPLTGLSGQTIHAHAALELVSASWATMALPDGRVSPAWPCCFSVWSRNAAVGIAAPVVIGLVMQLVGALGGIETLRPYLLTTPSSAWHGLLAEPRFTGPLLDGAGRQCRLEPGLPRRRLPHHSPTRHHRRLNMRRFIITVLAALAAVLAVSGAGRRRHRRRQRGDPARLERSLPTEFANLYADQAKLLGHKGVTPASLHARAMCDKGGAVEADIGPGSNWNCLVSWTDPNVPMPPEGYGKFEVDVHSNGCYTASGPSKLIGFLTITDTAGDEVTNPVFEFDGCFDPNGDNTPTGVVFPSLLAITSTTLSRDADGQSPSSSRVGLAATAAQGRWSPPPVAIDLGSIPYDMAEESTATLTVPTPVPDGTTKVDLEVQPGTGLGPTSAISLPVQ